MFGPEGNIQSACRGSSDDWHSFARHSLSITGSSGNFLIINVGRSTAINVPAGTMLAANVPTSAQTSAAAIFPSYIDEQHDPDGHESSRVLQ